MNYSEMLFGCAEFHFFLLRNIYKIHFAPNRMDRLKARVTVQVHPNFAEYTTAPMFM